jgi:hypothetical protein
MRTLALAAFLLSAPFTAAGQTPMSRSCPDSGVRIYLHRDGSVTVNGVPVEAGKVREVVTHLVPKPTVVCYARDDPQKEPPPQAQAVVEAIIALRLPVGFFTDATFSTPVVPE